MNTKPCVKKQLAYLTSQWGALTGLKPVSSLDYRLSMMQTKLKGNCGLYRNDGLGVVKATAQETENIKKQLCKIFRDSHLKLTVEANIKRVKLL